MIRFESVFHANDKNQNLWTKPTFQYKTEIPDPIKFEGYLYKIVDKDSKVTKYKKKWFIITEKFIYYQKVTIFHFHQPIGPLLTIQKNCPKDRISGQVDLSWLRVEYKIDFNWIHPMGIVMYRGKLFSEIICEKESDYDKIKAILVKRCVLSEVWRKYSISKLIDSSKESSVYKIKEKANGRFYALKQVNKDTLMTFKDINALKRQIVASRE
jgi:hypothetical protein